jgi:predicted small lipoprotein YifL
MKNLSPLICAATLALALAACNKQGPEMPQAPADATPADTTVQPAQAPQDLSDTGVDKVEPVTVRADAIAVGHAVGPNQAVTAAKRAYGTGDTVYASMPTKGHKPGARGYVYWTYQDGRTHKEEAKPVEGEYLNFQFSQADGMKPGKYNVEIDIDDKPVGIVDFTVQ